MCSNMKIHFLISIEIRHCDIYALEDLQLSTYRYAIYLYQVGYMRGIKENVS